MGEQVDMTKDPYFAAYEILKTVKRNENNRITYADALNALLASKESFSQPLPDILRRLVDIEFIEFRYPSPEIILKKKEVTRDPAISDLRDKLFRDKIISQVAFSARNMGILPVNDIDVSENQADHNEEDPLPVKEGDPLKD